MRQLGPPSARAQSAAGEGESGRRSPLAPLRLPDPALRQRQRQVCPCRRRHEPAGRKPAFSASELAQTAAVLSVLSTVIEAASATALAVRIHQGGAGRGRAGRSGPRWQPRHQPRRRPQLPAAAGSVTPDRPAQDPKQTSIWRIYTKCVFSRRKRGFMHEVPATEFTRNFGRYWEIAQREPVAVTSHGRATGYFISAVEFEETQRLKTIARRSRAVVDLSLQEIEEMTSGHMSLEHDHLNALLDEK
jgi:PHD/YefM family antitoxin component YafN of YafNO toxin-antitoxin module